MKKAEIIHFVNLLAGIGLTMRMLIQIIFLAGGPPDLVAIPLINMSCKLILCLALSTLPVTKINERVTWVCAGLLEVTVIIGWIRAPHAWTVFIWYLVYPLLALYADHVNDKPVCKHRSASA